MRRAEDNRFAVDINEANRAASRWEGKLRLRCCLVPSRSIALALTAAGWVVGTTAAPAASFDLPSQDLASALLTVTSRAGVNLLYDPRLLTNRRSPAIQHIDDLDDALTRLLAGTGIRYHHSGIASVILSGTKTDSRVQTKGLPSDPAIPEILVIGRPSLNIDVPRSPDDIQPYQVIGSLEVRQSGAETSDEFLKTRLASNTNAVSTIQNPLFGNAGTQSQVNLRGLGTDETLVLVDGRRLPSFPAAGAFLQPNLNGIPVTAIDRIEVLPSTAGGIYGPGATGGVVNLVLRHDSRSTGLSITRGVSAQGDAPNWRIDAHTGFQTADGSTKASIFYSHEKIDGLSRSDRQYASDVRAIRYGTYTVYTPPSSASLNIASFNQTNLVLKPAYGGASLGSLVTHLALTDVGTSGMGGALLANAGTYDLSLSPDALGARQSLLTTSQTDSADVSLRHRFAPWLETYIDVLGFRSSGTATETRLQTQLGSLVYLSADNPANPFTSDILYSFPSTGLDGTSTSRTQTYRATFGALLDLPHRWRADLDFAIGRTTLYAHYPSGALTNNASRAPNLLANPDGFAAALLAVAAPWTTMRTSDTMLDANVKLAGHLFQLPGGPASMTLSGEVRSEKNPGVTYQVIPSSISNRLLAPNDSSYQRQSVRSVYDEVRLPILPATTAIVPLRSLEIQLAARADNYHIVVPPSMNLSLLQAANLSTTYPVASARHTTLAFTAGARVRPISSLQLRMSYATGYLPPTASDIRPDYTTQIVTDIKRSNQQYRVLDNDGGSPEINPERAQSLSFGVVATPQVVPGLRMSADFTRIKKSSEIAGLHNFDTYYVRNQDLFPDRVVRAPLTAADMAAGYTVGRIISVDNSADNTGQSVIHVFDFDVRYSMDTRIGRFGLDGHATWEPLYHLQLAPSGKVYSLAGFVDGPLRWKGNGGLSWQKGQLVIGSNVQVYGSYSLLFGGYDNGSAASENVTIVSGTKGNIKVAAQAYADLFATLHMPASSHHPALDYTFTVNNVLNTTAPIVIPNSAPGAGLSWSTSDASTPGYSYYGDPRGRRFVLTISMTL